jgi:hypothetical protein
MGAVSGFARCATPKAWDHEMSDDRKIYKILFMNQGNLYELYARSVTQGGLYGFVEVEGLSFGEVSKVLVDPSEERLKTEFAGVKRTYIPLYAVIRIDEVEKEGIGKIREVPGQTDNVAPFPMSPYGPGGSKGKKD